MSAALGTGWPGRAVLVTGCTGLLGRWLCRALCERGAQVVGIARRPRPVSELTGLAGCLTLIEGPVTDLSLLARALAEHEVSFVFHLAAQSQPALARRDPAATFDVNVGGTLAVLEAADRARARPPVVLASSAGVYGDGGDAPHREDEPLPHAQAPYPASKACAERVALSYRRTTGLPVVVVRTTNLYGGGDPNPGRIVPAAVDSIRHGERPVVRSDGRARRDYLHVQDAVAGYLAAARSIERSGVAGGVFNVGSGEVVSVLELVTLLGRLAGRDDLHPRVLGEPSGDPQVVRVNTDKARRLLGWAPRLSLEEGLRATLEWPHPALVASSASGRFAG